MNYDQMRQVINGSSRIKEVQADLARIKEENTCIVSRAHAMIPLSSQELARHEENVRKTISHTDRVIRESFGPVALPDLTKIVEKSIDKMTRNEKIPDFRT